MNGYVLRCRPGDLALVTRWQTGKSATCIELASDEELLAAGIRWPLCYPRPVWRIDRQLGWRGTTKKRPAFLAPYAPDCALLPIRPEPAPAEELHRPTELEAAR